MRRRFLPALAVLALAGSAPSVESLAQASPAAPVAVAVAAKSCSSSYTHARLPWGHKCLRAGQFCKRSWHGRSANRYYHRYGYHCKSNGHLRRY